MTDDKKLYELLEVIFGGRWRDADQSAGDDGILCDEAKRIVTALHGRCSRLEHENQTLRSKLLGVNGASPRPGSSTL